METNHHASPAMRTPAGRPSSPAKAAAGRGARPGLPAGGAPDAALAVINARFPRVAEMIRLFWDSPAEVDDYLSSLMLMDDDDRQGFPLDVMGAMLQVWDCHRARGDRRLATR